MEQNAGNCCYLWGFRQIRRFQKTKDSKQSKVIQVTERHLGFNHGKVPTRNTFGTTILLLQWYFRGRRYFATTKLLIYFFLEDILCLPVKRKLGRWPNFFLEMYFCRKMKILNLKGQDFHPNFAIWRYYCSGAQTIKLYGFTFLRKMKKL